MYFQATQTERMTYRLPITKGLFYFQIKQKCHSMDYKPSLPVSVSCLSQATSALYPSSTAVSSWLDQVSAWRTYSLVCLWNIFLSMNLLSFWETISSVSVHLEARVPSHTEISGMAPIEILSSMVLNSILFWWMPKCTRCTSEQCQLKSIN